jgi:hypothetical protein
MQRIIENDLVFPDINPTYMGRLFRLVQNIFPTRDEHDYIAGDLLTTYSTLFRSAIGTYAINDPQVSSQVMAYIVQSYMTNFDRHIITHYEVMNKLWIKQSLMHRGLPEAQSKRISIEIWNFCVEDNTGHQGNADEIEAFGAECRAM